MARPAADPRRPLRPASRRTCSTLWPPPPANMCSTSAVPPATPPGRSPRVAPGGTVLGVDISEALRPGGRDALGAHAVDNAAIIVADAQSHAFDPGRFDVVFSRFGVMFFVDPVAAFANVATAMAPGGRLAFAAWGAFDANPWFHVPRTAAIARLGPSEPAAPREPGPFAFENLDRSDHHPEDAGLEAVEGAPRRSPSCAPAMRGLRRPFACTLGPACRDHAAVRRRSGRPRRPSSRPSPSAFARYEQDGTVSVPASSTSSKRAPSAGRRASKRRTIRAIRR